MNVRRVLPKDAIPSVDDPSFVREYGGADDDEVIALVLGGEARAYPVRYLNFHEIVNDSLEGRPVAVTWCPLCGSAVVYDRRVDGRTLEFGVSGKLADDDLVMYDRETGSEWKQSTGVAIDGPLEGAELDVLPASMVPWETFRKRHRQGRVLAPPGGASEAAGEGDDPEPVDYEEDPYREYFASDGIGLAGHRGTDDGREWAREDIDPKAVVLGVERGGEALGFPLPVVEGAGGVVTATVGGTDVVVFAGDAGIHAYEDPGYDWRRVRGGFRGDGVVWDPATGRAQNAPATHTGGGDREPLTRVPARRLFAFAWQDDHGPDAFYGL